MKKNFKFISLLIMVFVIVSMVAGCTAQNVSGAVPKVSGQIHRDSSGNISVQKTAGDSPATGTMKVSFLSVGNADSILVEQNNHFMLVDTGNYENASDIEQYLNREGVKQLDELVLTHQHADHIGSASEIIKDYTIGKLYFPKIPKAQTPTTAAYRHMDSERAKKGLQYTYPEVGASFNIGDAKATILAPNGTSYEDENNYSIVLKVTFGNNSFLLTGDASVPSEKEMLDKGLSLKADVLKVGHHGSSSATSEPFLDKVQPKYAVISCGVNNDYGHPHKTTMNKLQERNIPVYRTDECGTIVATSDGNKITFNVKSGDYKPGRKQGGGIV